MSAPGKAPLSQFLSLTVFVAALGYFVDMFDLLLFPIVRQQSLMARRVAYTSLGCSRLGSILLAS